MTSPSAIVIGAGAFGGWTALHLLRRGARVTLIDAFGAGNSRSSSGDETRIIRALYAERIYVEMTVRARSLWEDFQSRLGMKLLRPTGFLRLIAANDVLVERAAAYFRDAGLPLEEFTPAEAARRFPRIHFGGVDRAIFDPRAGYLPARRCCAIVASLFAESGGDYRIAEARPGAIDNGAMRSVTLSDGSSLEADIFVFACGPWMGPLFPDVIGRRIRAHRREVFYFGAPPGDRGFDDDVFPCWGDNIHHYYGVPGNEARGFKIGEERIDQDFDPTHGERIVTPEVLRETREYLAFRFPALAGAPLVESRVCQYESTPDEHLVVDRHPRAANVILAGGGSGHGFKLGPAVGEMVAAMALDGSSPRAELALSRAALSAY
jgi:monomeric sarcosine oxidase